MFSGIQVPTDRAKNKAQASNVTKATGSWGVNSFVSLPNQSFPAFPDLMHNLKNIVCTFFYLIIGKGDALKVRKAEKELGRFPGCWPREKQIDEPEAEKAVQSRFLQSFITPKLSGTLMECIIHNHYRHYFRERIRNLKASSITGWWNFALSTSKCVWPHNVNKRSTG